VYKVGDQRDEALGKADVEGGTASALDGEAGYALDEEADASLAEPDVAERKVKRLNHDSANWN
jgi:hypothetical protein